MNNLRLFTAISTILITAGIACASSGESSGEHGSVFMTYFWQVLNFAILVTVLILFARKPLRGFLNARTEAIKKSVDDAREAKEHAKKALEQVKDKLKVKDAEIQEILSASEGSGQREKERIVAEAERLSAMLAEQVKSNIDMELKQGKETLKAEAARLALELAEKKIKSGMDEKTQKRLIEEALAKLEAGR